MPSTVNGIGTHYFGNKNRQVRKAQCRSCGHYGELVSYDTRLWIVFIFVPVIPLGRKRVIDQCPICKRHYVAKADEFAINSQLLVSEARDKYRTQPTVESALDAHSRMLAFHHHEEADALRTQATAQFPRDASLLAGFATHLSQAARPRESSELYEEAHAIQPELPEARIGLAYVRMNEGKLDEARQLLDFLESPGAGQVYPLDSLDTLAKLYQQKHHHKEALELFQHLLNEYPDAGQLHSIRQMIRLSEKRLKTRTSILPQRSGSFLGVFNPWSQQFSKNQKSLAFVALVLLLLGIGFFVNNEYIRTHRTLHILSGLGRPVTVQVDDQTPIEVESHEKVVLAEGPHKISVSGPITATYDIDMNASAWQRFARNPVWIVNIAGSACLYHEQIHYAVTAIPPSLNLMAGTTVIAYTDIDYPFVTPPKTMQLPKDRHHVTVTALEIVPAEPATVGSNITNDDAALTYLEAFLPLRPDDMLLFHTYREHAKKGNAIPRAEAFLKAGLERRPIEVNWHRAYQDILEDQGRGRELVDYYNDARRHEPDNGLLFYLRARIEENPEAAQKLVERAKTAAPTSPWPWYSLGYRSLNRGDWKIALEELRKAVELGFDPTITQSAVHVARLGAGEGKAIIAEMREQLRNEPANSTALAFLIDALASQGQGDAAKQDYTTWRNNVQQMLSSPESQKYAEGIRFGMLYEIGDFKTLEEAIEKSSDPMFQKIKAAAWLATLHPGRIPADPNFATMLDDPWTALSLSVAFQTNNNSENATFWRDKACQLLQAGSTHNQYAAKLLMAEQPLSIETIRLYSTEMDQKLIFLCALAQKFPDIRDEVAQLAHELNVSHGPPYHLVERVFPRKP